MTRNRKGQVVYYVVGNNIIKWCDNQEQARRKKKRGKGGNVWQSGLQEKVNASRMS